MKSLKLSVFFPIWNARVALQIERQRQYYRILPINGQNHVLQSWRLLWIGDYNLYMYSLLDIW